MEKKVPVIIDCDPGADDFFALLWLLINHKFEDVGIEVVGITTVGGNVSADITYANAQRVCTMLGIDDVKIGKDHRKIESEDASHIHGKDGIGNLSDMLEPVASTDTDDDSVDMLIEAIEKHGDELVILATGPLTNLALAESKSKGILEKAKKIIAMGGAIDVAGNVSPVAEFNIIYDYESASQVFKATEHIVLLPLDLTMSMVFTMDDLENSLKEVNHTNKQEFLRALTEFIIKTNMQYRETEYQKGFFIHDAHTVGMLLYPQLYTGKFMQVQVETKGEYTKGMTVVDERNTSIIHTNCFVATSFDKKRFLDSITQDYRKFSF